VILTFLRGGKKRGSQYVGAHARLERRGRWLGAAPKEMKKEMGRGRTLKSRRKSTLRDLGMEGGRSGKD